MSAFQVASEHSGVGCSGQDLRDAQHGSGQREHRPLVFHPAVNSRHDRWTAPPTSGEPWGFALKALCRLRCLAVGSAAAASCDEDAFYGCVGRCLPPSGGKPDKHCTRTSRGYFNSVGMQLRRRSGVRVSWWLL